MLKVASGPDMSFRYVFPMVGSDGSSSDPSAPPQGLVPDQAVGRPRLPRPAPQALVIARALQQYGFYIGDSGGVTALKLEDTRLEGRAVLATSLRDALCGLPLSPEYWDVLPADTGPR